MVSWLPTLSTLILVLRLGGRAPISFFQVAFIAVKGAQAACFVAAHGAPGPVVCSLLGHHGVQAVCRHRFFHTVFTLLFSSVACCFLVPRAAYTISVRPLLVSVGPILCFLQFFKSYDNLLLRLFSPTLKDVPVLLQWC